MGTELSRRGFPKASAASGVATALAPRSPLGAGERVVAGILNTGGRGHAHLHAIQGSGLGEVAAVCDVYSARRESAGRATDGRAKAYPDYREVLDRRAIDAVTIATPDHWHRDMFLDAIRAGKDPFCEKPMSYSMADSRAMRKAAKLADRIVQIGTQRRSGTHYPRMKEIIDRGEIGDMHFVRTYDWRNWSVHDPFAPPAKLAGEPDWPRFLGRAPWHAFDMHRFFARRWYWDYAIFDYGSHSVELSFDFVNGYHGAGLTLYGTKATLEVRGATGLVWPEGGDRSPPAKTIPSSPDWPAHMVNFLECVKTRVTPNAPPELGHTSLLPSHLANIAYRTGRKIWWDAEPQEPGGVPV